MAAKVSIVVLVLIAVTPSVKPDNILMVCAMTSKSETVLFYPYAEGLAEKGHEVMVISPYPPNGPLKPGVVPIVPKELVEVAVVESAGADMLEVKFKGMLDEEFMRGMMVEYVAIVSDALMLKAKEVKDLVNSGKKIDLIIINGAMNDFALPLVHLFKCPFIYLDGPGLYPWHVHSTGTPLDTSYAPSINSEFGDHMTFWERAVNTYNVLSWNYLRTNTIFPNLEKQLKPFYIKEDTPPLIEIDRNVSLVLSARDLSLAYSRSFPPHIVSIGCVHCRKPKPLPKDLAEFLDGSGDAGFIYLSFGSVVPIHLMKDFVRNTFFKAMSQMPQRFLVKWADDDTNEEIGAPKNVKLTKWCPQQDVLGHPKIKAFVTHSGLFSTMETVYHAVPILAFPFFFDQDYNAGLAERYGFGIRCDLTKTTAEEILEALQRLTKDPSYQKNAKHRSRLLRDHPIPPMEKAVYWTEYVMRHNGAAHLRPVSRELPVYKLYLLDIILVFGGAVLTVIAISTLILRSLLRKLCSKTCGPKPKKE